ncbi:hypothetical protein L6R52_05355 [Myxococcota bacterium]|nr:hypothetical protein [Myxococcota bacterium]
MQPLLAQIEAHPWIAVAAIAVVLVLGVVAVLILRAKKTSGDAPRDAKPPAQPPLKRVFARFVAALPKAVRGAPVTLVVGPRRAGKTSVLLAARDGCRA